MRKRCAIYTRKSTEEGLDQSFNSLDAQREACAAFIKSQAHEGWVAVSQHFDDGGYSGGSMDRPALQLLLADVRTRKIDIIVVYKIDRLTRSLLDFAKIVETLDNNEVSFVSVTQQFNTTTSMGRLMLNVLLSFAQFEREVTGERIRDKIAASKRKGMWMGGNPPLGYDVKDRQLVINAPDAQTVRRLFSAYLELGTVRRLKTWADNEGILTKQRARENGTLGGKPFSRGNLYALLSNPLYKGEVRHGKQRYTGQHQAIVEMVVWDQVNSALKKNSSPRTSDTNSQSASLLAGKLFDQTGDRLSPTHAVKGKKRYRYYTSRRLIISKGDGTKGWRLPAKVIENAVTEAVADFLGNQPRLIGALGATVSADSIASTLARAAELSGRLRASSRNPGGDLISLIQRIVIHDDRLEILLDRSALRHHFNFTQNGEDPEVLAFEVPMTLQHRGVETRLVIPQLKNNPVGVDDCLVRTVAQAFAWFEEVTNGQVSSLQDLAARDKVPASELSRIMPLAFLSPKIITAILDGRQPLPLTAEQLKRRPELPLTWNEQKALRWLAD
jgi:DNA invertase Pin-like site-specific DNA recombinase